MDENSEFGIGEPLRNRAAVNRRPVGGILGLCCDVGDKHYGKKQDRPVLSEAEIKRFHYF
jgi:hypothetical protein